MTPEECVEMLQQYYTPEQWENLRVNPAPWDSLGRDSPTGVVNLGEQACKYELNHRQLPLEVRPFMDRLGYLN